MSENSPLLSENPRSSLDLENADANAKTTLNLNPFSFPANTSLEIKADYAHLESCKCKPLSRTRKIFLLFSTFLSYFYRIFIVLFLIGIFLMNLYTILFLKEMARRQEKFVHTFEEIFPFWFKMANVTHPY